MDGKQADQAMTALKKMNVDTCVTIRDENEVIINSEDLVIGDIIKLEDGDNIPADIRIITSYQFYTNESSMTGESNQSVKSEIGSMVKESWLKEIICLIWALSPQTVEP